MTREEAINLLHGIRADNLNLDDSYTKDKYDALGMAIEALSTEPCEDCISRQAAQDYIAKYLSQYLYDDVRAAVEVIDEYIGELPSVTPKQKMGHWEYTGTYDEDGMLECSVCGREVDPSCYHYKFCPMCGAKMSENPTGSESED